MSILVKFTNKIQEYTHDVIQEVLDFNEKAVKKGIERDPQEISSMVDRIVMKKEVLINQLLMIVDEDEKKERSKTEIPGKSL